MRKFIPFAIVCVSAVAMPSVLCAKDYSLHQPHNATWRLGYTNDGGKEEKGGCYVAKAGSRDRFAFCGTHKNDNKGCNPIGGAHGYRRVNWNDTRKTIQDGDSIVLTTNNDTAGLKAWCCNGTSNKVGTFKEGEKWIVKSEYRDKQLADGKICKQLWEKTICADDNDALVLVKDCDKPDPCPDGQVDRAGKCVTQCPDGMVFRSETDNTCVACETTNHQGIVDDYCLQCDKNTQLFSAERKVCLSKAQDFEVVSAGTMKRCYMCSNSDTFKKCVLGNRDKQIIKDCKLDEENTPK